MAKNRTYRHIKPIAQDDLNGCWSASMAWWTKAMPSIPNWTDDEILVEYSHLRGSNGGLTFPTGFAQMLSDAKWGMKVDSTTSWLTSLDLIEKGLKKGPVMYGFHDRRVGGHHAVVIHEFQSSMSLGFRATFMDPNGGVHTTTDLRHVIVPGPTIIVGYQQ